MFGKAFRRSAGTVSSRVPMDPSQFVNQTGAQTWQPQLPICLSLKIAASKYGALGRGNFHERGKLMTEVSQSASETPARNFPKILKIPEKMSLCHVFVAVLTWFLPESNQVPLWDRGPKSTSPRNCPIYWPRCNPRDLIGSQIMKGRFLVAKTITYVVCHIASTCWQSGLLGLLRNKWFRKTSQMLVQICLEAVARVIWMFFPRSLSVMMKPTAYFISIIGQSLNLIWYILI